MQIALPNLTATDLATLCHILDKEQYDAFFVSFSRSFF